MSLLLGIGLRGSTLPRNGDTPLPGLLSDIVAAGVPVTMDSSAPL
jgi:hypothetical protein